MKWFVKQNDAIFGLIYLLSGILEMSMNCVAVALALVIYISDIAGLSLQKTKYSERNKSSDRQSFFRLIGREEILSLQFTVERKLRG